MGIYVHLFPRKLPVLPPFVERTIVIPTQRPLASVLRSLFYRMNFLRNVSPYVGPFLTPECSLYLQGPICCTRTQGEA